MLCFSSTFSDQKVVLGEACSFAASCLDVNAQCRGKICQCHGDFSKINNRCGKFSRPLPAYHLFINHFCNKYDICLQDFLEILKLLLLENLEEIFTWYCRHSDVFSKLSRASTSIIIFYSDLRDLEEAYCTWDNRQELQFHHTTI